MEIVDKSECVGYVSEYSTWDSFVYHNRKYFEGLAEDRDESTMTIVNPPNYRGFKTILMFLRDRYGSREAEYMLLEFGHNKFYTDYLESGLLDLIKIVRLIDNTFYMEDVSIYNTSIMCRVGSKEKNKVVLHLNKQSFAKMSKETDFLGIQQGKYALMLCIYAFNYMDLKKYIAFKSYHDIDGYLGMIKKDIEDDVYRCKEWITRSVRIITQDIIGKWPSIKRCAEEGVVDESTVTEFRTKINVIDEAIKFIERNNGTIPIAICIDIDEYKKCRNEFERHFI